MASQSLREEPSSCHAASADGDAQSLSLSRARSDTGTHSVAPDALGPVPTTRITPGPELAPEGLFTGLQPCPKQSREGRLATSLRPCGLVSPPWLLSINQHNCPPKAIPGGPGRRHLERTWSDPAHHLGCYASHAAHRFSSALAPTAPADRSRGLRHRLAGTQ
ncbi:hypothetical protein NDU88_004365 [Pleurodeles waltl]|uniref:Uncharacterized protein n=1 Tax=Pleurodeles waltl TaxID=8319 RepID=A0AAV7NJK8_PLEWA|nr:hypothetical protein NDU88_004365 [Pleurodeles waltl]